MRLEGNTLYLSRRNLLSLLDKLDGRPARSSCALGHPNNIDFWVVAEDDDAHYAHPSRDEYGGLGRPGPMHPETEGALRAPGA